MGQFSVTIYGATGSVLSDIQQSGEITIGIAPANAASISHNTYSAFSVPETGVNLDNATVGARTIINEVTSTAVTRIDGALTVIGPKADVIVANPNGIAVNGGRFQNTGNVALTTGAVGYDANNNVFTTTRVGQITIGSGGLSGTMEELGLISKTLRIGGPIRFDLPDTASHANIVTGDSTVGFDSARGGFGVDGTGQLPWALATDRGTDAIDAVVVDITVGGSLSAGRISVTVTDQGAGARFAGDQLASAGGFRLTSSGRLEIVESRVSAKESINISVENLGLASTEISRAEVISETSGVTIEAKSGDIALGQGLVAGRVVSSDNLASSGGVTLTAAGNISSTKDGDRVAELVSDASGLPNSQGTSNVVLTAEGAVQFDGLEVSSTNDFRITSNGSVSFVDTIGNVGGDFRTFTADAISFDSTTMTAQSDIRLDGSRLRFGSLDVGQVRTEVKAVTGGAVIVATSGDILNFGSLLQGRNVTAGDGESLGGMSIYTSGDFVNRSLSVGRLAVAFGETEDLHVEAGGDILNYTGRLFSNDGITLRADGDIVNETAFAGVTSPLSIQNSRGRRFASSLFLKRKHRVDVSGNFGDQEIPGEQSFILGVGDVSLDAANVRSLGADITGANVTISALGIFQNDAQQVGQFHFTQSCKWFCKTSGDSTLRYVGGTVTASDSLTVAAGERVTSLAGSMNGVNGLTITAPLTELIPAFSPTLIEHPAGLTGLFSGRRGYLAPTYRYGSLSSAKGDITINGDANLGEANLLASGKLEITGTRIETVPPAPPTMFEKRPIGVLWNVFD
jgi:filamentous hemagglutinin family protein